MKSTQYTMITALATANRTSDDVDVNQAVSASFQFATTDLTAEGTLKIQASNDNPGPSGNFMNSSFVPPNWADVPNATSTIVLGVGPMIVIPNMCFRYVRAVFTRTAGAGSFSILLTVISP